MNLTGMKRKRDAETRLSVNEPFLSPTLRKKDKFIWDDSFTKEMLDVFIQTPDENMVFKLFEKRKLSNFNVSTVVNKIHNLSNSLRKGTIKNQEIRDHVAVSFHLYC